MSLRAGFRAALELLADGVPVVLRLQPGTYRESVLDLDWGRGKAAATPLVIEGAGPADRVIWTGSDVIPRSRWKEEGDGLISAPWPHRFGLFGYQWTAAGLIAHRRELLFIGDRPLMPRILEETEVIGASQNPDLGGVLEHRFKSARDPKSVLKPGEFGVVDRDPLGGRIYARLPEGASGEIEASVRRSLLDLTGKSSVVLRNLTFQRAANDESAYSRANAVVFGGPEEPSNNVLIEGCRFVWNSSTGLQIHGRNWTIRNSVFNWNGVSGISSGPSENILFDGVETSWNVWRAWRGGEILYYTGGVKMHEVRRHTVLNHRAVGNATAGLWWDIFCRDVLVDGAVLVG
ncbi:MAG: right-handed parallel beta-helix repeat-containing protein, partial [Fimbriimonadaceae bacterium]|nr:right-handed parallel beta-helix repeat-containing protein [Fimbriimonadaceae bacterium]